MVFTTQRAGNRLARRIAGEARGWGITMRDHRRDHVLARRAMVGLLGAAMVASLSVAATRSPGETTTDTGAGLGFLPMRTLSLEPVPNVANSLNVVLRSYPAGDVLQQVQVPVSGSTCTPNLSVASGLVALGVAPVGEPVRFVDNGLGSKTTGGNCGGNAGRVVAPQTITLSLGQTLLNQGLRIGAARLNLEARQGAALRYTISGGGADETVTGIPLPGEVGGSNGANAAGSDNTMVDVARANGQTFTGLSLTTTGAVGSLGLDTGADSTLANDTETVLYLGATYEFEVPCYTGTPPVPVTDQPAGTGTPSIVKVEYFRFENGTAKDTECKNIGLQVDFEKTGAQDAIVVNPSPTSADGTPQDVQARVRLTWKVDRYASPGVLKTPAVLEAELARQIDYQDGSPVRDVEYCASATIAGDPTQVFGSVTRLATQDWCLLSDVRTVEGDFVIQVQVFDAKGDPKFF
jgi:hypothetical protein